MNSVSFSLFFLMQAIITVTVMSMRGEERNFLFSLLLYQTASKAPDQATIPDNSSTTTTSSNCNSKKKDSNSQLESQTSISMNESLESPQPVEELEELSNQPS